MKINFDFVKFILQRNDNYNYGRYLFNFKFILKIIKFILSIYFFIKFNGRC